MQLGILLLSILSAAPTDSVAVQGTWRSEGYGLLIAIGPKSFQLYEETALSCLPSLSATLRVNPPVGPLEYGNAENRVFDVSPEGKDRLRVHFEGAASDLLAGRIASLPAICTQPAVNTPIANFDIFARTFADHYILFQQKKIDWPRVVSQARTKITDKTTPNELFEVMKGMIDPLQDAHVSLSAPDVKLRTSGHRLGTDALLRGGRDNMINVEIPKAFAPTAKYLKGPLRSWCEGQVWSGMIDDTTAYLRLLSFSGFSKGEFRDDLANLEMALDSVLVPSLKRLIIDVRINFGGADPLGLAIASRLATGEYVAYMKQARSDPINANAWTAGQVSRVVPTSKPSFKGPVAILTSGLTISAGETFTQAMMGRRPDVFRVGEPTQGVFSDVLGRRLPNGFRFGLPNEVFRAPDGRTFDGPGIPPTDPVPVFSAEDAKAGKDSPLERALKVTGSR